jgi:hypothetical protein
MLIIVPGEKELWEMQRTLGVATQTHPHELLILQSESSQQERENIAERLETQAFRGDGTCLLVLGTAGLVGSSLTLYLNALVDTNRAMRLNASGFLALEPTEDEDFMQHVGRLARVCNGWFARLPAASESLAPPFQMSYPSTLTVEVASIALGHDFQVVGFSDSARHVCAQEL